MGLDHAVVHHALSLIEMADSHDSSHHDEDKDHCDLCDMAAQGGHVQLSALPSLEKPEQYRTTITQKDSLFHLYYAPASPSPRGPPVTL
jgi:hypothetical protein